MISLHRNQKNADIGHVSNVTNDTCRPAGRALTEIVLIAAIPLVSWLMWTSLTNELPSPWQSAASALPHGPLRTVRDVIDLKDGKMLVVHRNGELRFWNQHTKKELGEFPHVLNESRCGAFASRKRLLAIASTKGTVQIWKVDELDEKPLEIAADPISICACQFTNDEEALVIAGGSGDLKFWNPTTGELIRSFQRDCDLNAVHCLLLSADGQFVFAGTFNSTIYKWRLSDSTLQSKFQASNEECPNSIVVQMFELPGSTEIVVGTRDGAVAIWDHVKASQTRRLDAPLPMLISAAITKNCQHVVGVNETGETRVWDVTSGRSHDLRPFETKSLRHLAIDAHGHMLIGGDNLGAVEFADLSLGVLSSSN